MQTKRAMILVSNDPESIRLGANDLIQNLTEALIAYDLQDEVEISTLSNIGISNIFLWSLFTRKRPSTDR